MNKEFNNALDEILKISLKLNYEDRVKISDCMIVVLEEITSLYGIIEKSKLYDQIHIKKLQIMRDAIIPK